MSHLSRTLALVAFVVACVLGTGTLVVLAQSAQSTQRGAAPARAATLPGPTPPPLPFGDQSRLQSARRGIPGRTASLDTESALRAMAMTRPVAPRLTAYAGPRPAIPKLTDLLKHKVRWTKSASGGSIVLTGTSAVPLLDDQTLPYGASVYWLCQNLTPNTTYQYVLFPPDGTAYIYWAFNVSSGYVKTFTTDASGRCMTNVGGKQAPLYAQLTLQTPLGAGTASPLTANGPTRSGAADAPYAGVWTIAVENTTTSTFEAVAYTVVLGTLNFNTYSDSADTTVSNDFTSGSTVYVAASGLNPAHTYAFGFVNTGGNGLPCVYTIPGGAQNRNNATCFVLGATGITPTNQAFNGLWATPSSGANSAGTYQVELYDATSNDLISTQQISVNPSSVVWSPLVPYNGGTNGTNLNDTFATDGILYPSAAAGPVAEQSVQGLIYGATGLTSGHTYAITVSNANGVVMSSTTTDASPYYGVPQAFSPPPTFVASSSTMAATKVAFPLNIATNQLTSFGATNIPFAPNVYTAQLYDVTSKTVLGSKSFTILSYAGSFQWTNPAGAYVNASSGNSPTPVTATLTNTAAILYGTWNADGIKAVTIYPDSGNNITLGLQATTTTTDSAGQTWNVAMNGSAVTVTPAVAGQSLPPNGTLPIPFTIATPSGNCKTDCILQTSITPLHGIAPSTYDPTMTNRATNGLDTYGNGVKGTGTLPYYSWSVGAYSATQLGTPRYDQAMYRSGTDAASGGTYTLTITEVNNGTQALQNIEFVMPATVNPNTQTPTLSSVTVNGTATAGWKVYTQSGLNGATADTRLGNNDFALGTRTSTDTVPIGATVVFTIKMPILLTSFPFQEIQATGNYYDYINNKAGTPFGIGASNTLTNDVAGTTNIDSTELGVFSLDTSLISATLSPNRIVALPGVSTTFKLINPSTGLDPNPDYISQLLLTIPNGAIPNSITVTSPNQSGVTWNANPTGTAGQWLIDLCAVSTKPTTSPQASTPCAGTTDTNSLPPGDELDVTFNYTTAPTVGSYPINWTVVGANGGAVVAASGSQVPTLTVVNTTAQVGFTYAGGYTATPSYPPGTPITPVPANTQPTIGSWSNYTYGNAFVYELYNNGSTTITDVSLAIPASNPSGQIADTQTWSLIASSIYVYGAGASGAQCSANGYKSLTQPVYGSPGTQGLLMLSGCNLAAGQKLDIFFDALSPYDANDGNPNFTFTASVANGGAPADPRTGGNSNTTATYTNANVVKIVSDARLVIEIPTGSPGTYTPALFGPGTAASPSCVGTTCTYTSGGTYPLINLNSFTGTVTANDSLAASVYSDDQNGWNLSVAADINPSTATGQVSTWVSSHSSIPASGTYTKLVTTSPGTVIPTAGNLNLSTFTGAVLHQPIDNIMNYMVTVGSSVLNASQTTTVTLTYTLVAN